MSLERHWKPCITRHWKGTGNISIRFKIKPRDKKKKFAHEGLPKSEDNNNASQAAILLKLKETYGIKKFAAEKLINQYGIQRLEEEMIKIESSSSYLSSNIKNMGGYLVCFLSNEFSQLPSNEIQLTRRRKAEKVKEVEFKKERDLIKKNNAYSKYVQKQVVMKGISMPFFCQFILASYPSIVSGLSSKEEHFLE